MGPPQENKLTIIAKLRRFLAASFASVLPGNDVLNGVLDDASSDKHSVLKEPPPPQPDTQVIEPQGEPPPGASKWNFNLESLDATLTLPPVPADWLIMKSLPSEEERGTLPEAMFRGLERCIKHHRYDVVG